MFNKLCLFSLIVILSIVTITSAQQNTGILTVTNSCDGKKLVSLSEVPNFNLGCHGNRTVPHWIAPGTTHQFTNLNTNCNYLIWGFTNVSHCST